jgi:hypothetical protein
MWKQIVDLGKKIYSVTQDTQKNTADIKAIQTQLETLTETVRRMAYEQQRDRENATHERENLFLRLEVALLRSNRPPLSSGDTPSLLEDSGKRLSFPKPNIPSRAKSRKAKQ